MKVIGNENANKLLEWSIEGDDLIDADADEYVLIALYQQYKLNLECDWLNHVG